MRAQVYKGSDIRGLRDTRAQAYEPMTAKGY